MRLVCLAALMAACDSSNVCTPGVTRACFGATGCQGAQACVASGGGFGACECGDRPDAGAPDAAIASYPDCPTCMHAQYVIGPVTTASTDHGITFPQSNAQAMALGCDINADGEIDNQFGKVLGAFKAASQDVDVQAAADQAFAMGSVILLVDLEYTPDLSTTQVAGLKLHRGAHDANDGLSAPAFYMGGGRFTVTQPGAGIGGTIRGGVGFFGPGSALVELPLMSGEQPIPIWLEAASISGNITASRITTGKLCGAMTAVDVNQTLIPLWAQQLSDGVKRGGSLGNTIKSLFDADHSCDADPSCTSPTSPGMCFCISIAEFRGNAIIQSLLVPDLDLDPNANNPFTTDPNDPTYHNDAISIGVGFEASTAQFPAQ